MKWIFLRPIGSLLIVAASLYGCGRSHTGAHSNAPDGQVVNLYFWPDYLAPDTLSTFEKQTGIKVNVAYFDNNETMEARISAGRSGFDVVIPTGAVLKRQIRTGMFAPLDKAQLPNLSNLDPGLMSRAAGPDPGNRYAVIYTWGTVGLNYNEQVVKSRLPGMSIDTWKVLFDPAQASRLANCGINIIDDPISVVQIALKYLRRPPEAITAQDLVDVERLLISIRPFVRTIDTSGEIEAMANGDLCLALSYNGDSVQSRKRAMEANNGHHIRYVIPNEGSLLWVDLLAILNDAPHAANAHRLVNYLMAPSVMAHVTNAIGFANANAASKPLLDPSIASDTAIYPTLESQQRLIMPVEYSQEQLRAITRLWQKFKTGQ